MPDTTDIEALVKLLNERAVGYKKMGSITESEFARHTADALERLQAAARADCCEVVGKFDDCRATLAHTYEMLTGNTPTPPKDFKGSWYEWLIAEVERALAALDAPPEGEG